MTEKVELSPQEQAFLDYLFDGTTVRHPDEAKVMAGYPQDYPYLKIVKRCNQELIKKYDDYLAVLAAKGLTGLVDVMDNPHNPGSAVKLKAITELLNRAGVVNKQPREMVGDTPNYVFILPSKNTIEN